MVHENKITILMADDDDDDYFLAKESLGLSISTEKFFRVEDGIELFEYLSNNDLPRLILLDLNMPRKDGREVLVEIKDNPDLNQIPIVILSTSDIEEDKNLAKKTGNTLFFTKPSTFDKWVEMMQSIIQLTLGI